MIYIIHGPQACGKTRNGPAFAKFFGCRSVVELEELSNAAPIKHMERTLFLTNAASIPVHLMQNARVLSFDEAIGMLSQADA